MILRKFLLKEDAISGLIKNRTFFYENSFYLDLSMCKSVKYTFDEKDYKKVVFKNKIGNEKYFKVSKEEYIKSFNNKIGKLLNKKIYELDKNKRVEIFQNNLSLSFLNVCFKNKEEFDKFFDIKKYQKYIDEDVTFDKTYSDISIAKFWKASFGKNNIYDEFKKINKSVKDYKMDEVIYDEMNSANAIRIQLYFLYTKMVQTRMEIINSDLKGEDYLTSFRNNIEKIIILIKQYKDIFNKEIANKVLENLNLIYSHTDTQKNILAIKENFSSLKKCLDDKKFYNFLHIHDKKITSDVKLFLDFLKTKEYAIIIKQLDLLIKEEIKEENFEIQETIKKSLDVKIAKRMKKFKKTFEKYIDCDDIEGMEKILKNLKKLKVLADEFKHIFDREDFYKRKEKIDKLYKLLNTIYLDLLVENLLPDSIKNKKDKNCITQRLEKQRIVFMKKVKKSFKNL